MIFCILINQERLPKGIFMGNYNTWYMGLFNNIIERKTDGSSTIVNYDIILSEYARKKDLASYLHKGRNKQTFYIATQIWEIIK